MVDIFELYDMHCQYDCCAHEQRADASYVYPDAHAACVIHTILTLASGAYVPFKSPDVIPREISVARRIVIDPATPDGAFVTEQIAKGLSLDLIEELSPSQIADPAECLMVDAAFVALSGDMNLSADEAAIVRTPHPDIPAIDALVVRTASPGLTSPPWRESGSDKAGEPSVVSVSPTIGCSTYSSSPKAGRSPSPLLTRP